jgi:hypothetical protein
VCQYTINTWYHVVVTKTQTRENVWINGVKVIADRVVNISGQQLFAYFGNGYWPPIAMKVPIAMIYNRVITDAEITQIFDKDKNRFI